MKLLIFLLACTVSGITNLSAEDPGSGRSEIRNDESKNLVARKKKRRKKKRMDTDDDKEDTKHKYRDNFDDEYFKKSKRGWNQEKSFAIFGSPLGFVFGIFSAELEFKGSDKKSTSSYTCGVSYYSQKQDIDFLEMKTTGFGISGGYRHYLTTPALKGTFIGGGVGAGYIQAKYEGETAGGAVIGPGAWIGHRWLLSSFLVELGVGVSYYIGTVEVSGYKSSLNGAAVGLLLNAGIAFD